MNIEDKNGENFKLSDDWANKINEIKSNKIKSNNMPRQERVVGNSQERKKLDRLKIELKETEEDISEKLTGPEKEKLIGIFIRLMQYAKEMEGNKQSAEFVLEDMKENYDFLKQVSLEDN
jgi:hypothetical protein